MFLASISLALSLPVITLPSDQRSAISFQQEGRILLLKAES
jgi:hypothetical protein